MSQTLPPPNPLPGDFSDVRDQDPSTTEPVDDDVQAQSRAPSAEPSTEPSTRPSTEPSTLPSTEHEDPGSGARPHDSFASLTSGTDADAEMAPKPESPESETGETGVEEGRPAPTPHSDWDETWVLGPSGGLRGAGRRPRRWQVVAGSLVLVVLLVAGGFVLLSSGSGSQALALSFVRGHTDHYRMATAVHITGSLPGASMDTDASMRASLAWHVHRVGDQGVAAIDVAMSKIQVQIDGKPIDAPQQVSASMKIAPDGRVLSAAGLDGAFGGSGSQPAGASTSAGQQIAPVLPEGDVSIGDSWTRTFSQQMPGDMGSITVKSTSRYVRDQNLNGIDTAVVQTDYDIPIDASIPVSSDQGLAAKGTIHDAVTSWMDLDSNRLQQVVSNTTADLTLRPDGAPSGSGAFTMHETALTTLHRV